MKIMINYDLIDKAREAKTGFSLHKYTRVVGFTNGIAIPAMLLGAYIGNTEASYVIQSMLRLFGYSLFYNAVHAVCFSVFRKQDACLDLEKLSSELNRFCVETDAELLKSAYKYHVEYGVDFSSFPPKVEQKKYIMVPVHNDWGNNERSVLQKHAIGSLSYALSYGEPEKKKTYSYKTRRLLNSRK